MKQEILCPSPGPWKVPADLEHCPVRTPKPLPGWAGQSRQRCRAGATLGSLISAIVRLCLKMALQNGWAERAVNPALTSQQSRLLFPIKCVSIRRPLQGWGLLGGRTAEVTVCPTHTNPKSSGLENLNFRDLNSPHSLQNLGFPKQNRALAFRVHEFHPSYP